MRFVVTLVQYAVLGAIVFALTAFAAHGVDPVRAAVAVALASVWSATLMTVLERVGYRRPDPRERVAWGALLGALSIAGFTGALSWVAWGRVDSVLVPMGALLGGVMQAARAFSMGGARLPLDDDDGADDTEGVDDPKELVAEGALVIDVRRKPEWDAGHLPQAKHVPLDELPNRLAEIAEWLGGDKSKPVVVHCQMGGRSARAKALLEQNGFTHVVNGIGMHALK